MVGFILHVGANGKVTGGFYNNGAHYKLRQNEVFATNLPKGEGNLYYDKSTKEFYLVVEEQTPKLEDFLLEHEERITALEIGGI